MLDEMRIRIMPLLDLNPDKWHLDEIIAQKSGLTECQDRFKGKILPFPSKLPRLADGFGPKGNWPYRFSQRTRVRIHPKKWFPRILSTQKFSTYSILINNNI
jgi:hypothetical protein